MWKSRIQNQQLKNVSRSAGKPSQQKKMQAGFKLKKGEKQGKDKWLEFCYTSFQVGGLWFTTAGLAGCMWQAGARSHTSRMTPASLAAACSSPSFQWRSAESGFPAWIQTSGTPPARVPSGSVDFYLLCDVCMSWSFCEERLQSVPQALKRPFS